MNDIENQLKNIKKIKLSDKEKSILRTNFLYKMHSYEEEGGSKKSWSPAVSPFSIKLYSGVFAALLLIIYTGSVETALPGDNMYYFKTHINEPFIKTVAITPQMKADVSVMLLRRRYEEVSKLSIKTNAEKEAWKDVRIALLDTTQDAQKNIQELVNQKKYAQAASLINDQNSVLEANKSVLNKLGEGINIIELNSIIETLGSHQDDNLTVSSVVTKSLDNSDAEENVVESLNDSTDKLTDAEKSLISEQETGDVSSAEILSITIERAKTLVEEGKKLLQAEDQINAFLRFEEAKKILTTSLIINEVENSLKIEIDALISTSTVATSTDSL